MVTIMWGLFFKNKILLKNIFLVCVCRKHSALSLLLLAPCAGKASFAANMKALIMIICPFNLFKLGTVY